MNGGSPIPRTLKHLTEALLPRVCGVRRFLGPLRRVFAFSGMRLHLEATRENAPEAADRGDGP